MAEVPTPAVGVGPDTEIGGDEPGDGEEKRRPQRDDERQVGAAEEEQGSDHRCEEQADEAEGDLSRPGAVRGCDRAR